jgi:acetyl-CoA/propionyl-CoA carboxylase biotin carboxyl carrier protein
MEDREWLKTTAPAEAEAPEVPEGAEVVARDYKVEVSGKLFDVKVIGEAITGGAAPAAAGGKRPPKRERKSGGGPSASSDEALPSPLQGIRLQSRRRAGRRGGLVRATRSADREAMGRCGER